MLKIASFLYQFIFIEQNTKKISHTKAISVFCGLMMILLFPYAVIHGDKAGAEIWFIFGALAFGSRHLKTFLDMKSNRKDGEE